MPTQSKPGTCRVGVVGTGFIARGFILLANTTSDLKVTKVLTRRPPEAVADFPDPGLLTNSRDELYENSDIILECSGDVLFATEVVEGALSAGLKVATMNTEFHVTTGSAFVDKGYLTETNGDQPGVIATLRENALSMGFKPLVYGNIKGFLNENPTPKEMKYWSEKSGVRLYQIVSFTDGTKVEAELVFVANAFGVDVLPRPQHGHPAEDFMGSAHELGRAVLKTDKPHSDYLLSRTAPPGVFITAGHDDAQQPYLRYLKQGEGPTYVLVHNTHLCHLEIPASLRRVHQGGPILMNNTAKPAYSLKSIAKLDLSPGDKIEAAIGSFEVRGEAVRILDEPDHVPVGLIHNAVMKRKVPAGEIIRRDDIELPDTRAFAAWEETRKRVLG